MRSLVVASILTIAGCAHVQPGAWTCSASSVAAVIDSISAGQPSPSVDDAASCWLDLWREQPRRESSGPSPEHVQALEAAVASGGQVGRALVEAHALSPDVCQQ